MISLLPLPRVIGVVASLYAAVLLIVALISPREGIGANLALAFSGVTALQLVMLGWIYIGWRWLWRRFPRLGTMLFPDISGEWAMTIDWIHQKKSGQLTARCTIVQTFVTLSMEVHSDGSDSQTLIAQPRRDPESGRATLYYVYVVNPKAIGSDAAAKYDGAAILRYFPEEEGGTLRGNYWTSVKSKGHFTLLRLS